MFRRFVLVLSLITLSIILSFMEYPWDMVAALIAAATLVVLSGYEIPKFVKNVLPPKIRVLLSIYGKGAGKQEGVIQKEDEQHFEKEIQVLPDSCPEVTLLVYPEWKYELKVIEVIGSSSSKITRLNHFAPKRFWLENEYTDVYGNYKVFPNLMIRKGDVPDPLVLDLKIEPEFSRGEVRNITVRISVNESRKILQKEFLIKASS